MKLSQFIERLQDIQLMLQEDPHVVIDAEWKDNSAMEIAGVEMQNCVKLVDEYRWIVLMSPQNTDQVVRIF